MSSKNNKGNSPKTPSKGSEKKKEIEAENLAKRKKDVDFQVDNDPKKTLKFTDWEQNKTDVVVTLHTGRKIGANDINVEYTKNDVRISLTDGRRWYCRFNREIDMAASRVQLHKMKVQLKARKLQPELTWKTYDFQPDDPPTTTTASTVVGSMPTVSSGAQPQPPPMKPRERGSQASMKGYTSAEKSTSDKSTYPLKLVTSFSSLEQRATVTVDSGISGGIMNTGLGGEIGKQQMMLEKSIAEGVQKKLEVEEIDLNHVKHDFYERDLESIVVVLYVKDTDKQSVQVEYGEKNLCVKFKTSNPNFLGLHRGTNQNTTFKWAIEVVDNIVEDHCKFKVTSTSIEVTLAKTDPRKWGALEASQAKSARVLPTPGAWQSTAKVTPEPPNRDHIDDLQEVQPKADLTDKSMKENWNERENRPSTSGVNARTPLILGDSNKENVSSKPTCMVSPLKTGYDSGLAYSVGVMGLDNLGNTCFMNSVLQVLANTKELRDYFLQGVFQSEINHDNPLGMGGKLAVSFATLLRILWSGKYRSYAPTKIKNLVAMKNSQFMGFAQHDAQEFLAFLLDGLHEDVNRVQNKPYTEDVDSDGRPDEVVANEAWQRHKSRNDSFIVNLFQGQYKSKLVCPVCGKVSITFDPFMHLSVPLPKKKKCLIQITFFSRTPYKKPVQYVLRLAKDARVGDLKEAVYRKTGVLPQQQKVIEAYKSRIQSTFDKNSSLSSVVPKDQIFVFEILTAKIAGEPVTEIGCVQTTQFPVSKPTKCSSCHRQFQPGEKLKRCTRCFKTAYCNQACQKQDWTGHRSMCTPNHELIGQPFIISLPKSQVTFSRLVHTMEAFSRYSINVFQPPVTSQGSTPTLNTLDTTESDFSPGTSSPVSSSSAQQSTSTAPLAQSAMSESVSCSGDLESQSLYLSYDLLPASASDTPLDESGQFSSQKSSSSSLTDLSQGTSTTEVASPSSDSSFITVGSASLDDHNCDSSTDAHTGARRDAGEEETSVSDFKLGSESFNSSLASSYDCPSGVSGSGSSVPPRRYVLGQQQERMEPPFSIRPCTNHGVRIPASAGNDSLQDEGDTPLELENTQFLAMDWKNNEKCVPYVMVQSKEIEAEDGENVDPKSQAEESNHITLDQCLSLFTEPEVLSPDHAWYCPRCKEHREATKQLSIWRLPAYLIIQLKRFSFTSFIWRDKIDKFVEYPVRAMNLSRHFMGNLPSCEPPPIYDLYGVVNHMGGIMGGHYTSYARCPDASDWSRSERGWRLFDDSIVSPANESQVVTQAGYVLFYKRRNMMVAIPPLLPENNTETCSSDGHGELKIDDLEHEKDNDCDSDKSSSATACYSVPKVEELSGASEDRDSTCDSDKFPTPGTSTSAYFFTDMDTVD